MHFLKIYFRCGGLEHKNLIKHEQLTKGVELLEKWVYSVRRRVLSNRIRNFHLQSHFLLLHTKK